MQSIAQGKTIADPQLLSGISGAALWLNAGVLATASVF